MPEDGVTAGLGPALVVYSGTRRLPKFLNGEALNEAIKKTNNIELNFGSPVGLKNGDKILSLTKSCQYLND